MADMRRYQTAKAMIVSRGFATFVDRRAVVVARYDRLEIRVVAIGIRASAETEVGAAMHAVQIERPLLLEQLTQGACVIGRLHLRIAPMREPPRIALAHP